MKPRYCWANAETLWPKQLGLPGVPSNLWGTKPLSVISKTVPPPLSAHPPHVALGVPNVVPNSLPLASAIRPPFGYAPSALLASAQKLTSVVGVPA
jgi:hypothetical protein